MAANGPAVGDPMPKLVLADAAGQAIDFSHQSVAGDTVLLWVSDEGNGWQPLPELEALSDQFAMLEAQPFAVAARTPVPAEPDGQVRLAFDPDRKLAAMFGLERGGVIVVEPRGRLAAVLPGPAFDAALAVCRSLHGRSEPSLRRGGAPVLLLPDVLERGLCEALMAYWAAGRKHEDLVSSGGAAQDTGQRLKRRADVMLQDQGLFDRVRQRLMTRVVTEMRKAFCFAAASRCASAATMGRGAALSAATATTARRIPPIAASR